MEVVFRSRVVGRSEHGQQKRSRSVDGSKCIGAKARNNERRMGMLNVFRTPHSCDGRKGCQTRPSVPRSAHPRTPPSEEGTLH